MIINSKTSSIEMSKKFAKAASKYGTEEYMSLQAARKDYPDYKIVTISRKPVTKKENYKGLTYEYMEMYIQKHDDEEGSIMGEYLMLRGKTEDAAEALAESYSYKEMRDWFLKKFPAIASFHEARAKLVA